LRSAGRWVRTARNIIRAKSFVVAQLMVVAILKIKRAFKIPTRTRTIIVWFSFAILATSRPRRNAFCSRSTCGKSTHLPNTITFSSTRILIQLWYHISYNKQCTLAIHFAKHNFGPFGHIFFVIILLGPESKTLFIVLFSSLCLGIFFFYFGIYRIFIFFSAAIKTTRCLGKTGNRYCRSAWFARASIEL
jgi:hypothetical protein